MQELVQKCPRIPVSNWNLEMLVFEDENLSEQSREPKHKIWWNQLKKHFTKEHEHWKQFEPRVLVACLVWQAAGAILSEDWLLLATVILRTWEEAVFAPKWKMCVHSVVAKVSLCGFVMLFCSANSYSTLNSLTLFWLAESVQWIFENSAPDIIAADYTIIMSMTLKVTVSHVKFASRQWWSKNMTSIFSFNV